MVYVVLLVAHATCTARSKPNVRAKAFPFANGVVVLMVIMPVAHSPIEHSITHSVSRILFSIFLIFHLAPDERYDLKFVYNWDQRRNVKSNTKYLHKLWRMVNKFQKQMIFELIELNEFIAVTSIRFEF